MTLNLARPVFARLLGRFRLEMSGQQAPLRNRKAAGLLAYLVCNEDRRASRTKLADLLWSDRAEEQARSSLRQTLADLRRIFGDSPALDIGRDSVFFTADALDRDADLAVAAARGADAAALADLLKTLSEGVLGGLDGLSPAYDQWLAVERTHQEERLVAETMDAMPAMLGRASAHDLGAVLNALERLDPLNERVARMRMRASHAAGDTAAVHRGFRRLAVDLERELGAEPSPKTRTLFDRLLTDVAAPDAGVDEPAPTPAGRARPTRTAPAILVSPLTSGGSIGQDIAAICTEDIRIGLARNRELRVLMMDIGDEARARAIMTNAIAAYGLSGSVRVIGERTVVNIQLGNAASGLISWSEQIRLTGPPMELIDEIVERVVGAVGPAIERDLSALLAEEGGQGAGEASGPREAAVLYARGRKLVREARTLAEAKAGAALLEAAIAQDSRHIGARVLLSQLYNTDYFFLLAGHDVAALRARALQLIEDAEALEPNDIRVKLRLAWCRLRRADWAAAERLFRAAVEAMPHDADALDECAYGLAYIGELALALELMQRAFRLNPFAPVEYHADQAVLLALAGEASEAEQHFSVCGERRLPYLAFRLGNLLRLGSSGDQLRDLCDGFAQGFAAIWQGVKPPTPKDAADWLDYSICLKRPDHRQFVLAGVEKALFGRREGAYKSA